MSCRKHWLKLKLTLKHFVCVCECVSVVSTLSASDDACAHQSVRLFSNLMFDVISFNF